MLEIQVLEDQVLEVQALDHVQVLAEEVEETEVQIYSLLHSLHLNMVLESASA